MILIGAASASTPGCPDCPDWVNFDAWWDRYHTGPNEADSGSSTGGVREQALKSREEEEAAETVEADYTSPELLVHPGDDLSGRVLLDARSPADYESGHLPGARNLYWRWLNPAGSLEPEVAVDELRRLGVNETDLIVVYGKGDDSAYLFWALEYLGHENLSRLDGDIETFSDLDLVSNSPESEESNYTSTVRQGLLVNESMLDQAQESLGAQIVDTRSSFSDYASIRISNSMHLKTSDLYSDPEACALKSAGELEKLFSGRGLDQEKVQIVYGTPEACSLYFALRTMGYRATVLDGEWWKRTDYAKSSIFPDQAKTKDSFGEESRRPGEDLPAFSSMRV
ncbi:sulfurtransferase [Methanocrinis sp.]|uniref:sulfurtransferase n=1 Tax=Methanocrinis sp. TaxID=3101522 RepID=UPI003D1024F3